MPSMPCQEDEKEEESDEEWTMPISPEEKAKF